MTEASKSAADARRRRCWPTPARRSAPPGRLPLRLPAGDLYRLAVETDTMHFFDRATSAVIARHGRSGAGLTCAECHATVCPGRAAASHVPEGRDDVAR